MYTNNRGSGEIYVTLVFINVCTRLIFNFILLEILFIPFYRNPVGFIKNAFYSAF
jgi:hypothetical protein